MNKGDPGWIPTYGPDCPCYYNHEDPEDDRYAYVDIPYIGGITLRVFKGDIRRR